MHLRAFSILKNKLIGHNDDSTLIDIVQSLGVRVAIAEFLNRDLCKVIVSGVTFGGIQLNANKAKTMTVTKSLTMNPKSPLLNIGGTVLKESND